MKKNSRATFSSSVPVSILRSLHLLLLWSVHMHLLSLECESRDSNAMLHRCQYCHFELSFTLWTLSIEKFTMVLWWYYQAFCYDLETVKQKTIRNPFFFHNGMEHMIYNDPLYKCETCCKSGKMDLWEQIVFHILEEMATKRRLLGFRVCRGSMEVHGLLC